MKKLFIIMVLGIFLGSAFSFFYSPTSKKLHRLPASDSSQWMGKHQRLFDIKIKPIHGIPPSDDKDITLTATIRSFETIKNEVHFTWVLPPEASHVGSEEQLSDSVPGSEITIVPDEKKPFTREITLQGVSLEGEAKIIVLQAYTEVGGVKIGNAAVFSTKPEEVQFNSDNANKENTSSTGEKPLPPAVQQ